MKRIIAFSIIAAIIFSFPSISLAAQKKTVDAKDKEKVYEISLETIDEIMFKSSKYLKDSQERTERLALDQSKYEREIRKLKKEDSGDGWGNASSISSLYDQLSKSKYDLEILNITETAGLKKQALTAKGEYLKYIGMALEQELLKNKIEQQRYQNSISEQKYKRGLISLTQYKEIMNKDTDYSDELSEGEKKLEKQIENFKSAVGLKVEDKVEFKELKDFDYDKLGKISLDKDMEEAIKISKEIQVQEVKVEHLQKEIVKDRRGINDSQKELAELKDTVKKNFKNQYELLDTTAKKVNKSSRNLKEAQSNLDIAKAKYDRGLMSKKDFEELRVKKLEVVNQGKSAELELQEVFLTYQLYKEGYQGAIGGSAS
nr:TolC family protein [uncultured Aminipila sp.]